MLGVRRREFIAGLGGAAAWPLVARAQQGAKLPIIGFLGSSTPSTTSARVAAFVQGFETRPRVFFGASLRGLRKLGPQRTCPRHSGGGTAFDTRIEEALDVLTLADLPPRGSTG
jgi:hypothetical protein